jgi:hypothetical protein
VQKVEYVEHAKALAILQSCRRIVDRADADAGRESLQRDSRQSTAVGAVVTARLIIKLSTTINQVIRAKVYNMKD